MWPPYLRTGYISLVWPEVQFVDSHCHLDFPSYQDDLVEVIQRAVNAGVQKIIVPGLDLESSQQVVKLAHQFSEVFAAIGVHPSDVEQFSFDQLPLFERMALDPKVVAIGEIGLDLYYRQDNLNLQIDVLSQFLRMASVHQKPVILHSRNSLGFLFDIVSKHASTELYQPLKGIMHAFEGNLDQARYATEFGYLLGAGGPVTFKNATTKHEVFSKIEMSSIVLETDGPFLSPQAYRGKRNEPSYIPLIAQKIADLQHCDITEVAIWTTRNVYTLFNWTL